MQSAWGMSLGGSSLQFGFTLTPAGGCYVEDETVNCIINRNTIITIENKDDNCVWCSLLASYTIGNRKTRVNEYDKPNVIAKAKELCMQCECEFNKCVNFIEIPAIEEKLNTYY